VNFQEYDPLSPGGLIMADNKNTQRSSSAGMGQSSDLKRDMGTRMPGQTGSQSSTIRERMNVVASCGTKVGVVDHVEGEAIKLTKNDSRDGQHHFIPVGWVDRVDNEVHLKKNSQETEQGWKSDAAACGCG
jgi:hypothetical protein